MSEFRIVHRPALDRVRALHTSAVSLETMSEGHVIHVLGYPDGPGIAAALGDQAGDSDLRAAGPGQWLVVGEKPLGHAEFQALTERLMPEAHLVDVSHGRVRIAISGRAATRALAKGTAVDLEEMPVGQSATTLIGHISVHMTRTGADRFELIVLRSFAEHLWEEMANMLREFV